MKINIPTKIVIAKKTNRSANYDNKQFGSNINNKESELTVNFIQRKRSRITKKEIIS